MFSLSDIKELKLPDGSFINYELIKKYRRTVSLKITPKGLIVNAPILMTNYKINQLLQKKSKWIQKKLLLTSYNEEPFEIKNGVKFKILDKDEQTKTSGYFCYLNLYSKKQIQEMIS